MGSFWLGIGSVEDARRWRGVGTIAGPDTAYVETLEAVKEHFGALSGLATFSSPVNIDAMPTPRTACWVT